MAKNNNLSDFLTDVANSIRRKKGITNKINPQDFASEIESIEVGGGGLEINGIIEQYKISAGENISAGDFVEFINNIRTKLGSLYSYVAPSCILLEENKVFIAYSHGSSYYLYGAIITIDGLSITTTSAQLNSTSNSCKYAPSCVKVGENKVFIAHSYGSNYHLYGTIVTIDGTTMTATNKALQTTSNICQATPSCILLEENKVFMAISGSNKYLYGAIVTIDGTTMTAKITQLNSTSSSCYYAPSCVKVGENKVFIAHSYSSAYYLYGTIATISGTEMTAKTVQLHSTSNSCYYAPSCILLEENKVFIAHAYGSSYYLYGTIVTINEEEMNATSTKLNNTSNSCYQTPSCILLEENKVFIAHAYSSKNKILYVTIANINGTEIVSESTDLGKETNSCYYEPFCIKLEDNKVFVAYSYLSTNLYSSMVEITGTSVNVYAKKYVSLINGVAKTSGTAGDMIEIYVPNE